MDEGNSLTLNVEVYSVPEPQVYWYKDGKEVKSDTNIKIFKDTHRTESYSLTLNIVKGSDSGDYEVKVVNQMGEVTSKSRVIVQGKFNSSGVNNEFLLHIVHTRAQNKYRYVWLTIFCCCLKPFLKIDF